MTTSSLAERFQKLTYDLARYYELCDQVCAKELGVTASQGYILLALPDADSIPMNELSARMRLANSTMTRMVDPLVQKGMAAREPDPADRRIVRVRLTDQGRETGGQFRYTLQTIFSQVLKDIPDRQQQEILASLSTLNSAILNVLNDCCGKNFAE